MLDVLANPETQREMLEWAGGWGEDSAVVNTSIVLNKGAATCMQS